MGRHLAALGLVPDAIVSSPKIRAAETAAAVSAAVGCPVVEDPRLAGMLDLPDVEAIRGPRAAAIISSATTRTSATCLGPRRGDLARDAQGGAPVDQFGPLEPGSGTLRWLIPSDALTDG